MSILPKVQQAKAASIYLAGASTDEKNRVLESIIEQLRAQKKSIFAANCADVEKATADGLATPLLKRLAFDDGKLAGVIAGIESLIRLPDPVGTVLSTTELDSGLVLRKVSCPIGVIGVIFESRPDALVQISTLCLKSGNAAVLKGGSEALRTNSELARVIREASSQAGVSPEWLQLAETRDDVNEMLTMDEYIDLIIPRGSNAFVQYIMNHTTISVMGHADGICHVYIDSEADVSMARDIAVDSKCQCVSVCNACETLLVHRAIAENALPVIVKALRDAHCSLVGCEETRRIIPDMAAATEQDWDTEYLDYKLSIRVVDSLDEAIDHINRHGSGHTDVIVTSSEANATRFMTRVDSADVFWNCSSRFADGFRFGLGAEVGISTHKVHARGPVGLEGLVIYKWLLAGHGHVVAPYVDGTRHFTHRKL